MDSILSRPPHGHHVFSTPHHLFPDASRHFMKIFMVAGEASGDIYGGLLAKHFTVPTSSLQGWGGENMQSSGVKITKHYQELAYMGLWEVISNLPSILNNLNQCWKEIQAFNPDAIVLIDFPGFNMRIAHKARKAGINVFQVVAPKVWAWRKGRVKNLARDCTAVFPVLPFEHDLLSSSGVNSIYHGHPITETLDNLETYNDLNGKKPILALLPGSRKQELQKMLPLLLEVAKQFPSMTAVIAGAPGASMDLYKLATQADVKVEFGKTREILKAAQLAVIASGTATLEAALIGTPHILVYKTSWLTYYAAKLVIKVKFIGLTNLILEREVIPELIQGDCTVDDIQRELNSKKINDQKELLTELRRMLGEKGASEKIAKTILETISTDHSA